MKYEKNTLYIKGGRNTEVTAPDVTLGDILSMECTDKLMLAKIRSRKILRFPKKKKGRRVISVLEIISCIHEEFPDLDVRNLGERTEDAAAYLASDQNGICGSGGFLRRGLFHHGI